MLERRTAPASLTADEAGTISGYASRWGVRDLYGDVLTRGAFAASLAQHKADGTRPVMLWSHDPIRPVGTWDSIVEDSVGLRVRGRLTLGSTDGADAYQHLKAGSWSGLSIGFKTVRAAANPGGGRTVAAVDLAEISLVTRPAQSAARVTHVRSAPAGLAVLFRQCAARLKGTSR